MTKVSVVIPNWNGKEFLQACLPSLKKQTYKDFETIVVDNGSEDGSIEYLKKFFPEVIVIALDHNTGFAPAVNLGIKRSKAPYVILLNNDTKVDPHCLAALVKAADEHADVGMVAAKMLQFYSPTKIDSAGDYIDAVGHANNIGMGETDGKKFEASGYIFLVTGGGSLIKREVFKKIGLLDEDYFAYFEDVDFGLRAQMAGFKAWFEPKARIYHIHKATSSRIKPFAEYLQFRNMTMTVIKNFPNQLIRKDLNWLKIILVNINTIRFLASKGLLKQALQAEWYIVTHLPTLLQKRRHIQAQLAVPENYIIEQVRPKKITFFGLFKNGI